MHVEDQIRIDRVMGHLLDEVAAALTQANEIGAASFEGGDYDTAQQSLARAANLRDLRERLLGVQADWRQWQDGQQPEGRLVLLSRGRQARLRPGERTPEEAFVLPILTVLVNAQGSARSGEVLRRVEAALRSQLREVDYQATRSNPRTPRWWVTAQRCRNRLAADGLLSPDSARGVWEISPAGRRWLADHSAEDLPLAARRDGQDGD
ncbi:MAG: winged helix-turn-helix domain-containing protein [Fimbriimonadaceae bacterium]|nr:winged helix-turn-helix domain-containing protein [Fimbriimonadaceae bacterium]